MKHTRLSVAAFVAIAGSSQSLAVFPATFELSALNGTNGFVLNGIDLGDGAGKAISAAGDVNGDGIVDLMVGAYRAGPGGQSQAGETYIVYGSASIGASGSISMSALDGTNGFTINGGIAGGLAGDAVSAAGDLNNDGIDDIVIGARSTDFPGLFDAGRSYVVFGQQAGATSPDLNADDCIDSADLAILLAAWTSIGCV